MCIVISAKSQPVRYMQTKPPENLHCHHGCSWIDPDHVSVHLDYAGAYYGQCDTGAIDAHSKWIEAHSASSSATTINKGGMMFSTHRIPDSIIAFTSYLSPWLLLEHRPCTTSLQRLLSSPVVSSSALFA